MLTELQQQQKQLYETDYHLWVVEMVKQLQNGDFDGIDGENLINGILDLSKPEKKVFDQGCQISRFFLEFLT